MVQCNTNHVLSMGVSSQLLEIDLALETWKYCPKKRKASWKTLLMPEKHIHFKNVNKKISVEITKLKHLQQRKTTIVEEIIM